MDATLKKELQIKACKVRKGIIEGTFNAKSGHPGGSLSIAEAITYLYFKNGLTIKECYSAYFGHKYSPDEKNVLKVPYVIKEEKKNEFDRV